MVNIAYDRTDFRTTRFIQKVRTRDLAQVWSPIEASFRARIAKIGNGNNISHNTSTAKVSRSSVSVAGTVEMGGRTDLRNFGVGAVRSCVTSKDW